MAVKHICNFLLGLLCTALLQAEENPTPSSCARVSFIIGQAFKLHNNESVPLKIGEFLSEGTHLETKDLSFLKLILSEQSILDLGPRTKLVLKDCSPKKSRNKALSQIEVELELGKLRANVNPNARDKRKSFKIKTPTSVFAVRGTELYLTWGKESSGKVQEKVAVTSGEVEARSISSRNRTPALLSSGTSFIFSEGASRIAKFGLMEQRKLEENVKIEDKSFEESVDLTKNTDGSAQKLEQIAKLESSRDIGSTQDSSNKDKKGELDPLSSVNRADNLSGIPTVGSALTVEFNVKKPGK